MLGLCPITGPAPIPQPSPAQLERFGLLLSSRDSTRNLWLRPPASECPRVFPETIVRIWALVGRVLRLVGLQFVQLFPDALGCHGNAFNPGLSHFPEKLSFLWRVPFPPQRLLFPELGASLALWSHPFLAISGNWWSASGSKLPGPLSPSTLGSFQNSPQSGGSASVPSVQLESARRLPESLGHLKAPLSPGKGLADPIALGCFRKRSMISWHPLAASPAGVCSALSANTRPSRGTASASLHPPGPNALGHFRRGRARVFGTAAVVAEAGIPRLRRRRPRWSHGSGSARCDGGLGGGGGRDQVSPGRSAWRAGLACVQMRGS